MLLLVIEAEHDERRDSRRRAAASEKIEHRVVDVGAIGANLVDGRPAQQAADGAAVHLADRVVIRVEQVVEPRVVRRIARSMRGEHEALEEPRRMREMPFRGARLGSRSGRPGLRA